MLKIKSIVCATLIGFAFVPHVLIGYTLPRVNLGSNNILDGGPIRPNPGFYWQEIFQYYHADKFLNNEGCPLAGVKSPTFSSIVLVSQLVYQAKRSRMFRGAFGGVVSLPIVLSSHISKNFLNISDAGAGVGNLVLGGFLQFNVINYKSRPLFIHRLELDVFLPVGTNKFPQKTTNPASIMTYIDPYWAATLFLTEKCAASWRMHYLWCAQNKKTNIKPGQTFHMNYSLEYNLFPHCWVAINGYYLQQLKESTLCGVDIPHSKERVLAVGPGALYILPKEYFLFGYLYVEKLVHNRPQGIKAVVRLVKHF